VKVGFFGKLPGYGDFIQRSVSPSLINRWDNWLLQSIEASRAQLKESWKEIYFNSPIWRFTVADGVLGKTAVSGIIMPSIDNSGRAYPFTVMCQAQQPVNVFSLANSIEPLHENGEEFILSLLDKARPDLDEITEVLQKTYSKLKTHDLMDVESGNVQSVMELGRMNDNILPKLTKCNETFFAQIMRQQNTALSIWSMPGTMHLDAQIRYYNGLPPVDVFSSLLVGH
jgi:type VI secretion system protein ImpM